MILFFTPRNNMEDIECILIPPTQTGEIAITISICLVRSKVPGLILMAPYEVANLLGCPHSLTSLTGLRRLLGSALNSGPLTLWSPFSWDDDHKPMCLDLWHLAYSCRMATLRAFQFSGWGCPLQEFQGLRNIGIPWKKDWQSLHICPGLPQLKNLAGAAGVGHIEGMVVESSPLKTSSVLPTLLLDFPFQNLNFVRVLIRVSFVVISYMESCVSSLWYSAGERQVLYLLVQLPTNLDTFI